MGINPGYGYHGTHVAGVLYGGTEEEECAADVDSSGYSDAGDVGAFVAVLLSPPS